MIGRTAVIAVSLCIGTLGCGGDDAATDAATDPGGPASSVPGDSGDTGDAPTPADVVIDTFIFDPNPVEVAAGSTVTFRNDDDILHTVTQGTRDAPVTEGFDENLDGVGSTAEVVVAGAGTVPYFCSIHAGMDAELIVN